MRREERVVVGSLWCAGAIGLAEGVAEGRGGVEEGVAGGGVVTEGAWHGWRAGGGIQLLNSGCCHRGRPDAMLRGGSITYLFGCLCARMFKKNEAVKLWAIIENSMWSQ